MKNLRRRLAKWTVIITWPIMIIVIIMLSVAFIVRDKQLKDVENTYSLAQSQLNQDAKATEGNLLDLKSNFSELVQKVDQLQTENKALKSELEKRNAAGLGSISGKILPYLTAESTSFNQYQQVCAESIENKNLQYCTTVSALNQNYQLFLPSGKYTVFATLYPNTTTSKANYTNGVACAQNRYGEAGCSQTDKTPIQVTVVSGQEVMQVDPIDWSTK